VAHAFSFEDRFMNDSTFSPSSRREFLKNTGRIAAVSALSGITLPSVHAAGSDLIRVALIGCGGRGTGAAGQALSTKVGPTKLVAMADVFETKLRNSYENLSKTLAPQMDVPEDRKFIGFDAYQKAMDCLKPGDVAIFATPPAFRWVHFTYAIQKGLNVFMEKPVTVDGPTTKRMFQLAEEAEKKNLKVGVGLMVRHCKGRRELWDRIRQGQIGDITYLRAYRMGRPAGTTGPNTGDMSELLYQVKRFHSFIWASGGLFSDFNIHQIDECCWMKDAWPVRAQATGGRHYRGDNVDQNFDHYSVEYVFPDGVRFLFTGQSQQGCLDEFASYAHGTKGSAIISTHVHTPGRVRIFKNQNPNLRDFKSANLAWSFSKPNEPEPNPYQLEWDDLMTAIRKNQPYNEVKRGAIASLVTSMGRMAAHTGQVITYDEMLNCDHEFAPNVNKLTMNSEAPLQLCSDGKYPLPQPGILKTREY
jgi:predicted dehydrogenase